MKLIAYARVSTAHHDQKPEVQIAELRRYCAARRWEIGEEIIDHGFSGSTDQRPGLKRLMALVRDGKVNTVVVTKFDRMARSLKHLVAILDEFQNLNVQFISVGDRVDFHTASGRLMFHIVASFSEFERSLIRERTLAGLAYARSIGKKLGRPQVHSHENIQRLRDQGYSYRKIARELSVPMGTITQAIRGAHKTPSQTAPKIPIKSRRKNG